MPGVSPTCPKSCFSLDNLLQTRSERFTGDAKAQDCTPTNRDGMGHSLSAWRAHPHANAEGCLGLFAVLVNPSLPVEVAYQSLCGRSLSRRGCRSSLHTCALILMNRSWVASSPARHAAMTADHCLQIRRPSSRFHSRNLCFFSAKAALELGTGKQTPDSFAPLTCTA